MRKILAFVAALSLCMAFVACDSGDSGTGSEKISGSSSEESFGTSTDNSSSENSEYTITFSVDMSIADKDYPMNGYVSDNMKVTVGERYELPVLSCEGYFFKGWKLDGTTIDNVGTWSIERDVTLTAVFEEDPSSERNWTEFY